MNVQNYKLNITPGIGVPPIVRASQNDVGRPLSFTLYDGASAMTIPAGSTIQIHGTKQSGLGFTETCTWSGSVVSIDTTLAMTQESGSIPTELVITDGTDVIATANFVLMVEPSPHSAAVTDGTVEEAVAAETRCQQYAQAAQSAASTAADAADAAEAAVNALIATIPHYWESEINTSIDTINDNVMSATASGSATVCFITDLHWATNKKYSPAICQKLFDNCNINYFVNGGDLVCEHYETKEGAVNELRNCINAFRGLSKPMITIYGNHDRNRANNTSYSERLLSQSEHANTVFKSFLPNSYITPLESNYNSFYWEDSIYRYVCLYWYYSESRDISYLDEMFNTDKPVVIFCHGIYFSLSADGTSDVIDNGWILNGFESKASQIKCIIQGHTHVDGLRRAWGTVPIICIDCDTFNSNSEAGTITEQSIAVITIDTNSIKVVKIGRGADFTVTADSADWRQTYE